MASKTESENKLNNNQDVSPANSSTALNANVQSLESVNRAPQVSEPVPIGSLESSGNESEELDIRRFFQSMKEERERLKTFLYGEWPLSFIKPKDLANAGFFFLQNGDRVQCAFCKGVVCRWEPGDVPLVEHSRHYGRCPFILGYDVGNVPMDKDPVRDLKLLRPVSGRDVCGGFHRQTETTVAPLKRGMVTTPSMDLKEFGVQLHRRPKYEKYVSFDARSKTFKDWKGGKFSGKEYADAGFFMDKDLAICFFCGLKVCDKETKLDPWREHARRQPECVFVLLNKGGNFVEACLQIPLEEAKENIKSEEVPKAVENVERTIQANAAAKCSDVTKNVKEVTKRNETPKSEVVELVKPRKLDMPNIFQDLGSKANGGSCSESELSCSPRSTSSLESFSSHCSLDKDERLLCKVCFDCDVGVLFLPCSHIVACPRCAPGLLSCPICRKEIKATVRTFFT